MMRGKQAQGKHARSNDRGMQRGVHVRRADCGLLNKVGYPLAFAALLALAIGPGYAIATEAGNAAAKSGGAPVASSKDETVYVFSKADGSVKNIEVSDKLGNADKSSELADSSTLSNIENAEGDETYSGSGVDMVWNAGGNDIYYKGETSAELPISMSVTYRLDGSAVSADELAGKSGKVEIAYSFKNNTQADDGVQVPLAAITGMLLDNEKFSDIEIDNGKVVDDGDRTVVVGYAMPGLAASLDVDADTIDIPSGFTVKASASDFELNSTLTMVTGNLFDSIDMSDLDTGELSSASGSLQSAMSQLIDGAGQLSDGAGQLASGTATMQSEVGALPDGVQKLYDGSGDLAEGLDAATGGASKLASGAKSLSKGVSTVSDGASDLSEALDQISAGTTALADETKGIPAAIAAIDTIAQATPSTMTRDGVTQLQTLIAASSDPAVAAYKDQINGLLEYAYQAGTGIVALDESLDGVDTQVKTLAAGANQATAGAKQLAEGASSAAEGASSLSKGASDLSDSLPDAARGASSLNKGLGELNDSTGDLVDGVDAVAAGASQLSSGAGALLDGLVQFDGEGISKIIEFLDSDLLQTPEKLEAVRDAGEKYDNFSGITEGTKGTVKFVIETDAIEG